MTIDTGIWFPTLLAILGACACSPERPGDANGGTSPVEIDVEVDVELDHSLDAGPEATPANPEDAGADSIVDAKAIPDQPELDVGDAAVVPDASRDNTPITQSVVTHEGVCNGTPLCGGRPCECDATAGDGGCGYIHCEQNNTQSQCVNTEGCSWQIVTQVNEGTETGKRCRGDVGTCEERTWECKPGCVESFVGNRRVCSGTPEPCSAKLYSSDCKNVWSCNWE